MPGLMEPERTVKDWRPRRAGVLEVTRVKAIIGIRIKIIAVIKYSKELFRKFKGVLYLGKRTLIGVFKVMFLFFISAPNPSGVSNNPLTPEVRLPNTSVTQL